MIARRAQPTVTEGIVKKTINPPPSPGMQRPLPPRTQRVQSDIDVSKIALRHDLPLVNWTVVVRFRDRPDERFPVQARDPLSASRLVHYVSEREWPADKLLAVESIHPVRE